jgi:hypothetical protein
VRGVPRGEVISDIFISYSRKDAAQA